MTIRVRRDVLASLKAKDYRSANAGLWLDKYLGDIDEQKKEELKAALVKQVASIPSPDDYKYFYKRWKQTLAECGVIDPIEVKVSGRIAVGLGSDSVLETSITLHRTYGVPYIPGSALKGLALRYAKNRLEKSNEWSEEHTRTIFGDEDNAGFVTFFDALYVLDNKHNVKNPIHPDVMTVHHPNYYQPSDGKISPPADWDDPTPIPFLSATGTYLLAVAALDAPEWAEVTLTILEKALAEEGIGAKTSSGYGRLK
jgi:CRISPR-associated protein Cmr6